MQDPMRLAGPQARQIMQPNNIRELVARLRQQPTQVAPPMLPPRQMEPRSVLKQAPQ